MPVREREKVQEVPWAKRIARARRGPARPLRRVPGARVPGAELDSPIRPIHIVAVLASGTGFTLAFPIPDLGILAWVTLVPLLLAVRRRAPRAAFWLGYLWGAVAYGGVLLWVTTFGVAVWALAAALLAAFPALAVLAIAWVERDHSGPWIFLWIASVWTAVEFLRSQGPLGFPWALLGETQHRALPIIQIASLTGVYGVTFLVALVNAILYTVLTRRARVIAVGATGFAAAAILVWGMNALRVPSPTSWTAAAIQPNFTGRTGSSAQGAADTLAVLKQLTREAAGRGARLVVWPETASPIDVLGRGGSLAAIQSWARDGRLSVVASSLEQGRTNSAFAVAPTGILTGRYDKMRLVPFAEVGEEPGRAPAVLPTPQARVGIAICFESIFPEIARRSVGMGANLLAVITNDAWFDGRTAPAQHAALAPFRAVEEGRYLIRAANQGISAIIDPRGRILAELPLGDRGILTARVASVDAPTVYARIGDAFGWGITLLAVALVVPRALAFVAEEAGTAPFSRLITDSVVPLLVLAGVAWAFGRGAVAVGSIAVSIQVLALLGVTTVLSVRRTRRELGFRIENFVPAVIVALAAIGALTLVARHAFASHGAVLDLAPPRGGWWTGIAVQVCGAGLALEWWLRGLVFSDAASWRGWKVAVVWSALLGMAAASPSGAEAMMWAFCGGTVLGLIRARWPQVPALAVAHGVGNVLLGFLISPW